MKNKIAEGIKENMKEIQLTQGKVALVDDSDFEYLNQFRWCAHKQKNGGYYATRKTPWVNGKRGSISMHRAIMNPSKNMQVDHRDHNTLNNCRQNLRVCTKRENQINIKRHSDNSCGFKGVVLVGNKWRSRVVVNGKGIHLGMFFNIKDAAHAYNEAAKKYFGEFALLNEI